MLRCQPLIPYLESRDNIEEILEQFSVEAKSSVERRRQLLALQYYIREIIVTCQLAWLQKTHRVTNFRTLVDQVQGYPEVCFVTFNYDTLLENALRGIDVQLSDINSYVSNPNYKLFKLHGSTDWWAWRSAQTTKVRLDHHSSEAELIRAAPELEGEATIQKEGDPPPHLASRELYHHYPAVAIPTLSKFGFICPSGHVEVLAQCIKKVDKIAIVGWRAGEKHFLEMLSKGLQSVVDVIAACGNYEAAKDTLRNVANAGIRVNQGTAEPGGFTEFVLNRRIESFLR